MIPIKFSYIEDPVGTSKFINDLETKLSAKDPFHLCILHVSTTKIDLAASFLFDRIIRNYKIRWQKVGVKIALSGRISMVEKKVNNFLLSFGMLKELGIKRGSFSEDTVDYDYNEKYLTLKIEGSKRTPMKKAEASTQLVEYFNACFEYNRLEITETARSNLVERFGEIMGNAEEHCGDDEGKWYALGCYDKDDHLCTFAIINDGKTIYESLSDKDSTAEEALTMANKLIDKNRGYFDKAFGSAQKYREPIWNMMALQDGISSKRTLSGTGSTRGQGIMDVLSFIGAVKAEGDGATVCIISGGSAIIVDYKYPILRKEVGGNKEIRRMMTFNEEGDIHNPPDKEKVLFLDSSFKGTIFAGSFRIDGKYLVQKLENGNAKRN